MMETKAILTAGLLLAASAVFAADPTVEVSGGAAKTGQNATITFKVHPNGNKLNSATFVLDVATEDNANADVVTTGGTAPAGWDTPVIAQDQTVPAPLKRFILTTAAAAAEDTDPLVFTMQVTQKGDGLAGAKLTLVGYDPNTFVGSNVSDENFETLGLPGSTTGIVNGVSRNLGGAMNNTVSVAPGVIAAAAGSNLYLLDPASDTLADLAGWAGGKAIGGEVTGRPAFGSIGGALAVAVGANNGDVSVFDVASGNSLGKLTGTFTDVDVAPAIDANGNVFVAGTVGTGISVGAIAVSGGNATVKSTVVDGAAAATSSPAVFGGNLILGTDKGIFRATVDASGVVTPQATSGIAEDINTSPVVTGGSAFVGGASGNVYKINVATGAVEQTSTALPAPLSNPFAQGDHVLFGGADGKVHSLAVGNLADTVTDFASNPLVTPVDTGSAVYAGSIDGTVGRVGGPTVGIGGTLGSSITVLPAANQIVVNKTDGTVYAVPTGAGG